MKVCKTSLFNFKKNCLSVNKPERKMLNGLIKLVFTPDELATSKTTDKRKNRLKPLHQGKCSIVGWRFVFYFMFFVHLYQKYVGAVSKQWLLLFCFAFLLFLHTFSFKSTNYYFTSCIVKSNSSNHEWLFSWNRFAWSVTFQENDQVQSKSKYISIFVLFPIYFAEIAFSY